MEEQEPLVAEERRVASEEEQEEEEETGASSTLGRVTGREEEKAGGDVSGGVSPDKPTGFFALYVDSVLFLVLL